MFLAFVLFLTYNTDIMGHTQSMILLNLILDHLQDFRDGAGEPSKARGRSHTNRSKHVGGNGKGSNWHAYVHTETHTPYLHSHAYTHRDSSSSCLTSLLSAPMPDSPLLQAGTTLTKHSLGWANRQWQRLMPHLSLREGTIIWLDVGRHGVPTLTSGQT